MERRTSLSPQVKQGGCDRTIQEKNRNPTWFEGKGIVIGLVPENTEGKSWAGVTRLPAGRAEGNRSHWGLSYTSIHMTDKSVFLIDQRWDSQPGAISESCPRRQPEESRNSRRGTDWMAQAERGTRSQTETLPVSWGQFRRLWGGGGMSEDPTKEPCHWNS